VGCVPKKVMFNAVHVRDTIIDAHGYGFKKDIDSNVDYNVLRSKRDAYVTRLNSIYKTNLERDEIQVVNGEAQFVSNNTVKAGEETYTAPHIIIATGGYPSLPTNTPGVELGWTSDDIFNVMSEVPRRVAVVGAGYIAVELAGILNGLGSDTHLICRNDSFLREFDSEVIAVLRKEMEESKIIVHSNTTTGKVEKLEDGSLKLTSTTGKEICVVDKLIWAIGRSPITSLNLAATDIKLRDNRYIAVDEYQNTSVNGVYALGDVCGVQELTPVAIAAGRALSERLFNNQKDSKFDYNLIPTVIFSHPPLGTIGVSEEQAKKLYGADNVKAFKAQFVNMYFSLLDRKQKTFMKMITTGPEEKVVGLHLLGLGCDEMIQGFCVAIKMGATRKDFNRTTAIHPTGSEEVVLL